MKELTCSHCGHTGSDVHEVNSYIGGQGYVEIPLCDDGKDCWNDGTPSMVSASLS